jgi:catechol 2,3-dioxygenase-like lactoylglutathione lyase family enzyme
VDSLGSVNVTGLDHVQVAAPAGCEEAARRYYGELLGLAEIEKPEPLRARGGAWFQLGGQQLHIGVDEAFAPAMKAHPAIRVTDRASLEALAERLAAAGFPVHWDDALDDAARFYSQDPWGNRIELLAGN